MTLLLSRSKQGALGLTAQGVPVIPLRPTDEGADPCPLARARDPRHRTPSCSSGGSNPDANVGVLGGRDAFDGDGLTIVDVDQPDGPAAWQELAGVPVHEVGDGRDPVRRLARLVPRLHRLVEPGPGARGPVDGPAVRRPAVGQRAGPLPLGAGAARPPGRPRPAARLGGQAGDDRAEPRTRGAGDQVGLDDPVMRVPPPEYFRVLTGLVPDQDGFVCCPLHGEEMPSLKVYKTADKGWFCYGEWCRRGGDVISLAAYLAGIDQPVRGRDFVALLHYLHRRLIG